LVGITKRAAEIASHAPEHLQEAAFNRAYDQLSGGDSSSGGYGRQQKQPGRTRSTTPKKASAPEQEKGDDPATVLINSLSRTDHPEITGAARALDRALYLLQVAEADHGIDGMTAPQIAKVLTDKFRQSVSRQAIGQALDAAGKYVDRTPQPGAAAIYRLMAPGEEYLAAGGATAEEAKPGSSGGSQRKQRSRPRATAKTKPKAKTEAGRTPSTASSTRKRSGRSPKGLIEELIAEGFFAEPRTIGAIQDRLRHKKGVQLKATDLSPALVRLLRQNALDRERDESNQYEYSVPS
jgi:hypothetical protein